MTTLARIPAKSALLGIAILACASAMPLNAQAASSPEQPLESSGLSLVSEVDGDASLADSSKCLRLESETDSASLRDGHTDVFWGEIWLTDDGEPLSLYSYDYQSYPRLWQPARLDEDSPVLVFDLLDGSGEVVGSVSGSAVEQLGFQDFGLYGEVVPKWHRYAQFRVEIQNPPAYDSIVLRHEGREIGMIERSASSPVVEIVTPECGDRFNSNEQVRVIWSGYNNNVDDLEYAFVFFDGTFYPRELEYAVWYSVDNGSSYRLTDLKDDSTFYPSEFGGSSQVSIRVYANNGTRVSFDETHIEFTDIPVRDDAVFSEVSDFKESDCKSTFPLSDSDLEFSKIESTDIIEGVMLMSEDRRPLRLESLKIETSPGLIDGYPGMIDRWRTGQEVLTEKNEIFERDAEGNDLFSDDNFIYTVELRDRTGETVYSSKFFAIGLHDNWDHFYVTIPDPPDYVSIAVLHNSEEIGEVWRSKSDPVVQIHAPSPGAVFCREDLLSGKDSIDLSWSGFDPDGDDLEYKVWVSLNRGKTYRHLHTFWRSNIYFDGAYQTGTMLIRLYVNDGRRTAFAETYIEILEVTKSTEQNETTLDPSAEFSNLSDKIIEKSKCDLPADNRLSDDPSFGKIDYISGHILFRDTAVPVENPQFESIMQPVSVQDIRIETEPRVVQPKAYNNTFFPTLEFELRDTSGKKVHSVLHTISWLIPGSTDLYNLYRPSIGRTRLTRTHGFSAPIPNPPEYDSVAILYDGKEIGTGKKSQFSPVIEIVEPSCGSIYTSTDKVQMIYKAYDLDGDQLNSRDIKLWYSIDGGETYKEYYGRPYSVFRTRYFTRYSADTKRVFVRLHITDGMNTSFDETYFDIISTEDTPEQPNQTPGQPAQTDTTRCQNMPSSEETNSTAFNKISTMDSTDVIKGELYFSDDGEPLRLESLSIRAYPGIWEPLKPRKNTKELKLVLLDENSESIYSAPFTIYPSGNAEFLVRIPNPQEYESIAIYDSNTLIEIVPITTDEVPEIEIRESSYKKAYCHDDIIMGLDKIYINPDILHNYFRLEKYDLWISTDLGNTYQLLASDIDGSFTLNPSDIYGARTVFLRAYTSSGRRTAYDEISFQLIHNTNEENGILESGMNSAERCSDKDSELGNSSDDVKSTDVILGEILMSAEMEPQSLEKFTVSAYPGKLEPIDYDEPWYTKHSGLTIEFKDVLGNVVYCSEFSAYTDGSIRGSAEFIVRIPKLPEFESVVIFDSSKVLGSVERSKNTPTIKILSPITGSVFCYGDVMRKSELIQVVWNGADQDKDDLEYDIWYSLDDGMTYNLTSLDWVGTLHPADLFEAKRVQILVYVTDGTRTAFDEVSIELSTELKGCLDFPNFDISVEKALADCRSRMPEGSIKSAFPGTTDVIIGEVWKSYEGVPLAWSLEKVDSREILHEPRKLNEDHPMFMVELLNKLGETVHCSSFEADAPHGDFPFSIPGKIEQNEHMNALYTISVPNPPEYESIKILGSGGELWNFSRSQTTPAVSITTPSEGDVYAQNEEINLNWSVNGFDSDKFVYAVLHSTNDGTYKYIGPVDSLSADRFSAPSSVRIRVLVTEGTRIASDEVNIEIVAMAEKSK